MKQLLYVFFLIIFGSCNQSSQNENDHPVTGQDQADNTLTEDSLPGGPVDLPEPSDPIERIREKVESINNANLRPRHVEFTCDEKMMVDFYYFNEELVKISVDFGTVGDVYAKEDYYYDKGRFIFMYEFVEGGPACEGCIKTNEYRYYINDNRTIKYLKDDKEEACRKCEFPAFSRYYGLLNSDTEESIKKILCP